eukprot:12072514-Ditylum_brightwellii.AAC.1
MEPKKICKRSTNNKTFTYTYVDEGGVGLIQEGWKYHVCFYTIVSPVHPWRYSAFAALIKVLQTGLSNVAWKML